MEVRKDALKRALLSQRQSLSIECIQQASQRVAEQVIRLDVFQRAQHIVAYSAMQGEIDPEAILQQANTLGKQCYLPVITDYQQSLMRFYPLGPTCKRNRFGILEPDHETLQPLAWQSVDLVLVPLVAFDHDNHRLGMGGGFYDRALAQIPNGYFLGLAYPWQQVERLPVEAWDIPMHHVIY